MLHPRNTLRRFEDCCSSIKNIQFMSRSHSIRRGVIMIMGSKSNMTFNSSFSPLVLHNRNFSHSSSRVLKEQTNDDSEQRLQDYQQDRKMAQEKMQNIKKELTDFLKVKFNTDKKQEKQAERIKLAQNLGNIMIIIGFIVGLVLYVGENEKKKRSDYIVEESHNTNAAEDSLTQAQGGNINAQQFLSAISSKVNKVREENQKK
ncbi:hypothetical protein C9374_006006 [Naegleria lovaniensis]|uniref:Transmembrane protein n=1 Tax=Naegleria lovaniensis TaxID=51637 RepID=A0AA88GNS6_NAELO|nr:uncharacterized protein C9374_006006 [Naegleria lovaniensis]KAG2381622.1 hypothetical protein C9374_006006 [Naegleria lovaniensis]